MKKIILSILFAFTLTGALALQVDLGPDIIICQGETIPTIQIDSDFDDEDYDIFWYNNGWLIQTGGVVLTAGFTSGQIVVQVDIYSDPPMYTRYDTLNFQVEPLTAHAEITSPSYTATISTYYGPMAIKHISCNGITIDGSASSCENSYFIDIVPHDPVTWTATGPSIYSGWHSGQAPSNIVIPSSYFPLPNTSGYYLMTFAVGPTWTPTYVLFYYECLT